MNETNDKEKGIWADSFERDYKDLKPIKDMVSHLKEGGEYLSCPSCGYIVSSGNATIEDSVILSPITCGKCSKTWDVYGKLVGYKEHKE